MEGCAPDYRIKQMSDNTHEIKNEKTGPVPVVSFVGKSGSGKTTLLEKVVAELTRRGIKVGTVKHDAHGFEIDHEGKDSWRHKRAGARTVVLASSEKIAVIKDTEAEWPPARLVNSFITDVDVVVAEGFKESGFPKIEVLREANSIALVCGDNPLLVAVATDIAGLNPGVPVFSIDDFTAIADLIERDIIAGFKAAAVTVMVDGAPVALNPFVEGMVKDGISGMLSTLKGCEDAREIEIRVKVR